MVQPSISPSTLGVRLHPVPVHPGSSSALGAGAPIRYRHSATAQQCSVVEPNLQQRSAAMHYCGTVCKGAPP